VLSFMKSYTANNGYPPSVREIAAEVKVSSTATVHYYLSKLEEQGRITKPALKKRSVSIAGVRKPCEIPLVGLVHAGELSPAEENVEDNYTFSDGLFRGKNLFMLSIKGDSMKNAGLNDGDFAVFSRRDSAEHGEIVVAMYENEATVKRLLLKDGAAILHPENPSYKDIIVENPQIIGVLTGLIRRY